MATLIKNLTLQEIIGASRQWADYVSGKLGFDGDVTVEAGIRNKQFRIYVNGQDKFQAGMDYSKRIGRLSIIEDYSLDASWDEVCAIVWERLQRVMKRDEREIRAGLQAMGGILESDFQSEVGKLFSARIKSAREEATNHMIEFHGWQAAE